jgi:type VI secretion system protein ImpM
VSTPALPGPGDPDPAAFGFYGKLPARGDFVRRGLPRAFVDAWDAWLSEVIGATRASAGGAWLPAFREAPVWRFALPAGLCGADAAAGLMLPSVDRVGRYFPLTFAAVGACAPVDDWLDRCEEAGRAALEQDLDPDAVMAMLRVPDPQPTRAPVEHAEWWTEGSKRVGPGRLTMAGLPDAAAFARMLGLDAEHMDESYL